jgi:hypothetical protein
VFLHVVFLNSGTLSTIRARDLVELGVRELLTNTVPRRQGPVIAVRRHKGAQHE